MRDNIVLSYIMQQINQGQLEQYIQETELDKWSKKLDPLSHLKLNISAQLLKTDSLSDIVQAGKSLEIDVQKSSLSRVNKQEDRVKLFEMTFASLVNKAMKKQVPKGILDQVKILDTSYMLVPLKLFRDWKYDSKHGAVKMGVVFNPNTELPEQIVITDGKVGDTNYLSKMELKQGVTYLLDGGFRYYKEYDRMIKDKIDFIGRIQENSHIEIIEEQTIPEQDNGIYADQIVRLGKDKRYRMKRTLRIIRFIGKEGQDLWLVTTRFDLTAEEVVLLYKRRWDIEVFFKFIKQNLKVKHFWGTSKAAIKMQLYAALIAYLVVWLVKKKSASMLEALRFTKYTLFQRLIDVELAINSPPIILCND